jgi:large subunit ribosomal protein L23
MRLNNVVIKPLITEKSVNKASDNRYTFKVDLKASKHSVANEIKRMYNVDVIDVKTMVMPGKQRRILKTRLYSKTNNWKKAVVKVKDGQSIDVFPKEK